MKFDIITPAGRSEFVPREDLGIITIGRQPGNDISLPDEKAASRKQATIERTADGWKLIDQMSANGTALNGEKVNYAWLKEGDKIEIGATTIIVTGLIAQKPAAVSGSGKQAHAKPVKLPGKSAEAGEPSFAHQRHAAPASKTPIGGFVVAAVALVLVVAVVFGAISSGVFDSRAPEKKQENVGAKQAEISENEAALIAEAKKAASGGGTVLERLAALDEVAGKVPAQRASIATTRIDELRAQLLKDLEGELNATVATELSAINTMRESGDFAGAISKLDDLAAMIAGNSYTKSVSASKGIDKKITGPRAEIGAENDRYISGKLRDADELKGQKRYNEAIKALGQMLANAWMSAEDRKLYEAKVEAIKTLRDKPNAGPSVEGPKMPGIIEDIKKEDRGTIPGKNPLFPNGAASEKELVGALQRKLVRAAVDRKLDGVSFVFKGKSATVTGADKDRLFVKYVSPAKRAGDEEMVVHTKAKWGEIACTDMLMLYDKVPDLTKEDRLAEVIYALDNGLIDDGSARAFKLFEEDRTLKQGIDILLASKRHIKIPEGGFVEHEGRFVTPDEKESTIFNRRLNDVLERFQKGLGSKDKKRIEESEAAYQELLTMGERAIGPAIKILDALRVKEKARAESATGLVSKDSAKLKDLKKELDKRRKFALDLIMDTVKYPYPYFTEPGKQDEVQKEVDTRVAAVREIWDDPMSFAGQNNPEYESCIERLNAINARMDELDKDSKYHQSTAEEDIAYLKHIGNKNLNIRNFAGDDAAVKALLPANEAIMKYNEDFPQGEGHCDAEGREQVKITNEYRMLFERRALKINDKLFWAAKHHSRYCVEHNGGQIAHNIPGEPKGEGPGDRMKYEGYPGGGGENIHMNSRGPTAMSSHVSWCHSSGHHRNILTPGWKVLGSGKFGTIWTQCFGGIDEGDKNSESKGGKD